MRSKRARRHRLQKKLDRLTKNVIYGLATAAMGVSCWQHSPEAVGATPTVVDADNLSVDKIVDVEETASGDVTGGTVEIGAVTGVVTLTGNSKTGTGKEAVIAGGWTASGGAKGNGVSINDVVFDTISDTIINVFGGYTDSGLAKGNWLTISGDNTNISLNNYFYGGYTLEGTADDNSITVNGGTVNAMSLIGGKTEEGQATNNKLYIKGGTIYGEIYGAVALSSTAGGDQVKVSDNVVEIMGGDISGVVRGAYSNNLNTTSNKVTITGGKFSDVEVEGGYSVGYNANENGLYIGSEIDSHSSFKGITSGYSMRGDASDNELTIEAGSFLKASDDVPFSVAGGYSQYGLFYEDTQTNKNIVSITGGTFKSGVYGGMGGYHADKNEVYVKGGTFEGDVVGGSGQPSLYTFYADGNTVDISAGNITGSVMGGYAFHASGNNVNIYGGSIDSDVTGGMVWYNYRQSKDGLLSELASLSSRYNFSYDVNNLFYANGNNVTIYGGKITGMVVGGISQYGVADGNSVTISGLDTGSSISTICGGYGADEANDNSVTISSLGIGSSISMICGGYGADEASDNSVIIKGGSYDSIPIMVGFSTGGTTNRNKMEVSGGELKDLYIYLGTGTESKNNTLSISGGTWTGANKIYGGTLVDGTENNVLNISNIKNMSVSKLEGFTDINFKLDNIAVADGDVIINNAGGTAVDLTYTRVLHNSLNSYPQTRM